MDWAQFIIFFIGAFGLFVWNRTESRNDILYMNEMLKSNKDLIMSMRNDSIDYRNVFLEIMRLLEKNRNG